MTTDSSKTIYLLGCGAVGYPLAAFLTQAGRRVVAVRTSRSGVSARAVEVTVFGQGEQPSRVSVETVSLDQLTSLEGIVVVTSKSYANPALAEKLASLQVRGPVVILQNGIGVERPFLEHRFDAVYRGILYLTSQTEGENQFRFHPVNICPIGIVQGSPEQLQECVTALSTDALRFRVEPDIKRAVWKKAIVNAVFNSICPLLEADNGIFSRKPEALSLAQSLVQETIPLLAACQVDLPEHEIMEQIGQISQGSVQLISTLQDLQNGRRTEIDSLNLELARIGAAQTPPVSLPQIQLLGRLIALKSDLIQG